MTTMLHEGALTRDFALRECFAEGCPRTDVQPAILRVTQDDGTEVGAHHLVACPDHVRHLLAYVESFGKTTVTYLGGEG